MSKQRTFSGTADDDTLAEFKATAVLRRMTLREAYTEAMRDWVAKPEVRKFSNPLENFQKSSEGSA